MTRRTKLLACAAVLALLGPAGPWAADLPLPPAPKPAPANASPVVGPENCQEWTDGCRTCQRQANGEVACSNVGIACIQRVVECVRR